MCCSRGHYPKEVGLHSWSGHDDHYHILLPWSMSVGICIQRGSNLITASWRDFDLNTEAETRHESVSAGFINYRRNWISEFARGAFEVLTVGVAESGTLHSEWIRETLEAWKPKVPVLVQARDFSEFPEWKLIPPPALDYHEWLIWQAKREFEMKGK